MKKTIIGLDIGTKNIKAVQINREKNNFNLLSAGYIPSPNIDMVINPKIEENLAVSINRLAHDMKLITTDVSISLPSSKVITQVIEVPQMNDSELASSINWEAEQYIPWPLAKVKIDYAIIDKSPNQKTMKIQLVAAPIDLIEKFISVVKMAGLNPVSVETEVLAAARSLAHNFPGLGNSVMLSIGASTTEIGLLYQHNMIYTKSYPLGGNTFTRAIAQELGFEILQAEEYKKTYGLSEDKLEGKISKIITPFLTDIYNEIGKTVNYFREQYSKNDINSVIVCGGTAKLPGFIPAITANTGLNTELSNPFMNINVNPESLASLVQDAPLYTTAMGLSLKEID